MAKYPWVYVDVDTQFDFMNPRGALYIKGAEKLVPILQRLFERALAKNIPVISSADCHEPDDPEFEKFPPHCVRDTEGQKKLSCTLLANRCIVEPTDDLEDPLELLGKHQQLVFRKKAFDLFSNPNARRLFERLDCGRCVVFGVATDYCVAAAVKGLLSLGKNVTILTDTVKPVDAEHGRRILEELRQAGATLSTSSKHLADSS